MGLVLPLGPSLEGKKNKLIQEFFSIDDILVAIESSESIVLKDKTIVIFEAARG